MLITSIIVFASDAIRLTKDVKFMLRLNHVFVQILHRKEIVLDVDYGYCNLV